MHFLTYLLVPQLVSALAINQRDTQLRALYFLDSNPSGSGVAAMKINVENGSLSDIVTIPTGQKGALGLNAPTTPGTAAAPGGKDPLFSQDSIIVADDYLFTVNAGSDSVSVFSIDPKNPTAPKLLNSAHSLGDFPNAIAYSSALKTACVVNSGTKAGVACYSVDHATGLTSITSLLPIATNQTTPPVGPLDTASDIQFSPSSKYLLVTVKCAAAGAAGFQYVWPVVAGKLSTTPVISSIQTLEVAFGFSFLSDSKAVIVDAAGGAGYDLVTISPSYEVTLDTKVAVAGAKAICWSAYSARFNTIFIADGASTNLTLADPATGAVKGSLIQSAAGMGSLDLALDRNYLYVLQSTNAIAVSDLTGLNNKATPNIALTTEVQYFEFSGTRSGFTGLAVYPNH